MVQTADGSPEEGAGRQDDDMSNPMWVHIIRLLDDEEQATMVLQIFKQAVITRAIETDLFGSVGVNLRRDAGRRVTRLAVRPLCTDNWEGLAMAAAQKQEIQPK